MLGRGNRSGRGAGTPHPPFCRVCLHRVFYAEMPHPPENIATPLLRGCVTLYAGMVLLRRKHDTPEPRHGNAVPLGFAGSTTAPGSHHGARGRDYCVIRNPHKVSCTPSCAMWPVCRQCVEPVQFHHPHAGWMVIGLYAFQCRAGVAIRLARMVVGSANAARIQRTLACLTTGCTCNFLNARNMAFVR